VLPRGKWIDLLGLHHGARVLQAGMNVLDSQLRVACEDIRFGPPLGEQVDDQFDRQAGSADDRFPDQNRRVDYDALLPGHVRRPPVRTSSLRDVVPAVTWYQAAARSPCTRRSQPATWFQLAKMRLTSPRPLVFSATCGPVLARSQAGIEPDQRQRDASGTGFPGSTILFS